MLIEALVALSLFGIILTAVSEAHHTIARLSASASQREKREKELLAEHYKEPSTLSSCTSHTIVPLVVREICCELELNVDGSKKSSLACKLTPDTGFGLIGFMMASFFLMLLATLSYPTIKQLMLEKKETREFHSQKLSVAETEAELQRVLFDNQVFRIPGISKILSIADPLVRPALELTNSNYSPHRASSILLTSQIGLKDLTYPVEKSLPKSGVLLFSSCGDFPKDTILTAGFYRDGWDFFSII